MNPKASDVDAANCYAANFGERNWIWPDCLSQSTVATFELEAGFLYLRADDKEGFIRYSLANVKTSRGISPTRQVASRWYNVAKIVECTSGDVWFHRAGDDLWWTVSVSGAAKITLSPYGGPRAKPGEQIYQIHKPAKNWQRTDLKGVRLSWKALHPKARGFFTLEGTLHQLAKENEEYARALILGDDLSLWHDQKSWKNVLEATGIGAARVLSSKQTAIGRMASTSWYTAKNSNGQQVNRTVKNKEFRFATQLELENYLGALLEAQEGLCALSELELQFDGSHSDPEMLCSLDRIDSSGHYERGNLQIICRFLNGWKSDQNDVEFRRLLGVLRQVEGVIQS